MYFLKKLYFHAFKLKNTTLVFSTLLFLCFSAITINRLEPETFPTAFEGLWWTVTTATTVGYGDVSPATDLGKLFTMLFVYPVGISLLTMVIGKGVNLVTLRKKQKGEGKLAYRKREHYVVVHWSKKSEKAIKELLCSDTEKEIVLIDTLLKAPFEHDRFHYIKGETTDYATYKQANIAEANSILIFAPNGVTGSIAADGQTLLIASSIESFGKLIHKNIYTVVEIYDTKHEHSFQHANVEEFIPSEESVAHLMARSALDKGSIKVITQLLSGGKYAGNDIRLIEKKPEWKTYEDAYNDLFQKGAILISDGSEETILKKLEKTLPLDVNLYVICDNETYKSIKR